MGGTGNPPLTVAKALEIAKENQNGQTPPAVTALLEQNISEIWRKIQAQPAVYVMTKEQFAVFNYYRGRYDNNPVAQRAVARFWNHYRGDAPNVDGARGSSNNPSTPGSSSRNHPSSGARPSQRSSGK